MNGTGPQGQDYDLIVIGAGDERGEVLVLLEVTVEEDELLLAVSRVIDGVDIEGEMLGRGREGGNELIDENITQAEQGTHRDGVLETRMGRLTGQVGAVGGSTGHQLENRIGAKCVVIVLVLIVGEDAIDARACHFKEGVRYQFEIAGVVQGLSELLGEVQTLVELAEGEQPRIASQQGSGRLNDDGQIIQKREGSLPRRLYTHEQASVHAS